MCNIVPMIGEGIIVKAVTQILLLGMLLISYTVNAAVPIFGTTAESNHARKIVPPKGKTIVYIYQLRKDGSGVSPTIWLNNYEIGRLVPGSFTVWKLSPGRLNLRVGETETASISILSEVEKIYLFRLSVEQTATGPKAIL